MHSDLKDILFLDVETVGCADDYNKLSERLKAQWARKSGFFKRDAGQTDEDLFHEKAGIYAEFGKIVVIAIGKYTEENGALGHRTKYFADHDEKKLLSEFYEALEKMGLGKALCPQWKEFDFPYMSRRMLVNGIQLPSVLNMAGKKPLGSGSSGYHGNLEVWRLQALHFVGFACHYF
jgi:hypothetical protein